MRSDEWTAEDVEEALRRAADALPVKTTEADYARFNARYAARRRAERRDWLEPLLVGGVLVALTLMVATVLDHFG